MIIAAVVDLKMALAPGAQSFCAKHFCYCNSTRPSDIPRVETIVCDSDKEVRMKAESLSVPQYYLY